MAFPYVYRMNHAQYLKRQGLANTLFGIGFSYGLLAVYSHMFPEKLMVIKALPRIPDAVEGEGLVDKQPHREAAASSRGRVRVRIPPSLPYFSA